MPENVWKNHVVRRIRIKTGYDAKLSLSIAAFDFRTPGNGSDGTKNSTEHRTTQEVYIAMPDGK